MPLYNSSRLNFCPIASKNPIFSLLSASSTYRRREIFTRFLSNCVPEISLFARARGEARTGERKEGRKEGRHGGKEVVGKGGQRRDGRQEEELSRPGCAGERAGRGYACQLEGIQLSIA